MGKSFLADIPGNFFVAKLGSNASLASNGGDTILTDCFFVAPANIKILSAWRQTGATSEATKGTATTSASYRRNTIVNGGVAGSGTTIMASLNQTASQASYTTKAYSLTANNTATAGAIIFGSTLTVGAATADGTTQEAGNTFIAYELL